MAEPSTALTVSGRALPTRSAIAQELDRLQREGDSAGLAEVRRQAAAYQEYETRTQALDRANEFGRMKVMAEARLGVLDLASAPLPGDPLVFDGWMVPRQTRGQWRVLGEGLNVDRLAAAIELVAARADMITTHRVVQELRETGVLWVKTKPLLEAYVRLHERDGITAKEVARRAGITTDIHQWLTVRDSRVQRHARRSLAVRVAEVLGVDPATLEPVRQRKVFPPTRRRMPRARALPGGRLDRTYALIRKALQELDAAAGTEGKWGTGAAYQHLYEAEDIVGRALRRAV